MTAQAGYEQKQRNVHGITQCLEPYPEVIIWHVLAPIAGSDQNDNFASLYATQKLERSVNCIQNESIYLVRTLMSRAKNERINLP